MKIPIVLTGKDEASGPINSGLDKIRTASNKTTSEVGRGFKNMSVDIVRDFAGGSGQIVGHLSRMPSALGLVAAAAVATGAALTRMSIDFAQANSRASSDNIKFLGYIATLKQGASDLGDTIASKTIPWLNAFFDLVGVERTPQAFKRAEESVQAITDEVLRAGREKDRQSEESYRFALRQAELANQQRMLQEKFAKEDLERAKKLQEIRQNVFLERMEERGRSEFGRDPLLDRLEETRAQLEQLDTQTADTLHRLEDESHPFRDMEESASDAENAVLSLANTIANNLLSAIQISQSSGMKWFDFLLNIGASAVNMILGRAIGKIPGLSPGFENGGIVGAQDGMIVNRPRMIMVGEGHGREAIIPLGANKAAQRNSVMNAAGLGGGVNVTVNVAGVRNLDAASMRNRVIPTINREVRKGVKLLSREVITR